MRYFLDSAESTVIETWLKSGAIEGVTTNPTLARASGIRLTRADYRKIAELIAPLPLSVQCTEHAEEDLVDEARRLADLNDNIVVKVPILSRSGRPLLDVIHALSGAGVRVNVTACVTLGQLTLGAAAGASYVSFLLGRADDAGIDGDGVATSALEVLDRDQTSLIIGSIRSTRDLTRIARFGDCIATVPPRVLDLSLRHPTSGSIVEEFYQAAAG